MAGQKINFYNGKVAINVLAKDIDNAKEIVQAIDGHVAVGVLSKQFNNAEEGIVEVNKWLKEIPTVSVGLGAGDPMQWEKAAKIAAATDAGHVNEVFTGAPVAVGMLRANNAKNTMVNSLISPTGIVGKVKISTGPVSQNGEAAIVDVETAVLMLKDMGVHAVKFFPMGGLKSIEELKVVAKACAKHDLPSLEPTGGIDLNNFKEILKVCLDAGCKRVMPHVYNSIIDKETGKTRVEDVKQIYEIIKELV
ncbi:2-dehydro-3-deoxy-phosphogluconate aldolase [Clostridium weizhouense]|uniref:Oxo-acid lyase n=1 Tax=Clostridium weizhouense TaxID=2859781 RepID=A0ABS7AN62_9CLOT|nr:KDGP aldolase [Clostridium weizhouense]MBW6410105.1 oxo-acid lyase [Clostridium weizhouense]